MSRGEMLPKSGLLVLNHSAVFTTLPSKCWQRARKCLQFPEGDRAPPSESSHQSELRLGPRARLWPRHAYPNRESVRLRAHSKTRSPKIQDNPFPPPCEKVRLSWPCYLPLLASSDLRSVSMLEEQNHKSTTFQPIWARYRAARKNAQHCTVTLIPTLPDLSFYLIHS